MHLPKFKQSAAQPHKAEAALPTKKVLSASASGYQSV